MQKLLPLLRPLMENESQRQSYLIRAFGTDNLLLHRLVFNIPTNDFIPKLVNELVAFGEISPGKPALCKFLEVIRQDVGEDVKSSIDELLQQVREELKQKQKKQVNTVCTTVKTLVGHLDSVLSLAISPDGKIIASGSSDRTIKLWNFPTGEILGTLTGNSSPVLSLAFSRDGQTLASGSNMEFQDGTIKLWNVAAVGLKQSLGDSLVSLRTCCVAFSPNEPVLATGHLDATIRLWDLSSGEQLPNLRGHGWDVNDVTFSYDGRFLISGGLDGAIMIWNWRNGKRIRTLNRPSDFVGSIVSWFDSSVGSIRSVAISPDGHTIASGGSDQLIKLWHTNSGKEVRIFTEHTDSVNAIVFSPNGKIIVSGSEDKTMRIWNTHTGNLLYTFEHSGKVNCVAFSPDGKTLVSADNGGIVKVWNLYV